MDGCRLIARIDFDRDLSPQQLDHAASCFESFLRIELLENAVGGGPWGYGRALVKQVIVRPAVTEEAPS